MDFVLTATGLVILLLAGDTLVRGAVNLALRLGIPVMIVSLTVVAFGTSAPELLIAIKAALEGAPGIAIGNVVGSNTANILLVLGIPAVISAIDSSNCDTRKSYAFMLGASVVFIGLSFLGPLHYWHGVILLALLFAMLSESALSAHRHRANGRCDPCDDTEDLEGVDDDMPWWKVILFVALGLIGLPFGADLLVDGAIGLARDFGISESVIGLTLVAVGTSLPELATTVMAALRRQADVALGNVIGSNMFNLLGIMGIASFFGPLPIPVEILSFDLWVMLAASLAIVPFVFMKQNITRVWGAVLMTCYAIYTIILLS
ncbi:MAG: calcium/sodium antiporter [Rhodobacteraceae bacterium]|nr:calcium/sodium antiporter [Paracoccaceae bacterium]